ncbi:hypothetical protein B9Q04_07140 [Candidatus Marsarchaeota G2 archaeon BE_D]|uniref:Minichromosome maintenance protein MCM n=1 Tax=Candidatus Marsarchaeota G2 archaeon BE_D TaxID=1978158 RepID=A0A2R6CB64_9ARCH|nr:MAG: hypothetical protein B9Q04_07140 [Candidatus Marsarchaeota G2 archaeon BE_D]
MAVAEDAESAIRLYKIFLQGIGVQTSTGEKADLSTVYVGKTSEELGMMARIDVLLAKMLEEAGSEGVLEADFKQRCKEEGFSERDVEKFLEMRKRGGMLFEPKPGRIRRT